jgi:PAS domain S-box-containing protein
VPAMLYVVWVDSTDSTRTQTTFLSPQVEEFLGYTAKELLAEWDHTYRLVHPDDRQAVKEADRHSNETGEPFAMDYRVIARDGRQVWIHSRAVLVRDDEGRPRYWQGLALDITEQKRREEELRSLEARFLETPAEPPGPQA